MSVFMVTLRCTGGCGTTLRIGRYEPAGANLPYKYCPLCGTEGAMAECDSDADWWDAMCEAAQMPRLVLEPIYELWKDSGNARFLDYVEQFKNQSSSLYDEVMKYA